MALMTKGEFAGFMNVGPSAVSNWAKKGLVVMAADPDNPGRQKVDADKSRILVLASIDQTRGRPRAKDQASAEAAPAAPASNESPTHGAEPVSAVERARLEEMRERITRRRIENGQMLGTLVPLAEFERRAAEMGLLIRERTQALVREHAEALADETDPRAVQSFLAAKFDELFEKLASEIETDAAAELSADRTLAAVEAELEELEGQAD